MGKGEFSTLRTEDVKNMQTILQAVGAYDVRIGCIRVYTLKRADGVRQGYFAHLKFKNKNAFAYLTLISL
jgi:hypothetical protein